MNYPAVDVTAKAEQTGVQVYNDVEAKVNLTSASVSIGNGAEESAISFGVPLTNSVVPQYANGSRVATFTRATTATVTDWENIVRPVLSGEVRFQGARRVQNLVVGSEATTNWVTNFGGLGTAPTLTSGQLDPLGGTTAFRLQTNLGGGTTAADSSYIDLASTVVGTVLPVHSVFIKNNGGASTSVLLRQSGASTSYAVTIDNTWRRYSVATPSVVWSGSVGTIGSRGTINNGNLDILFWHPQIENVTGQSNTNPADYVSVGVLAAPYQGANVDGVQYFPTQNGNTVASNVVTAGTGASIAAATLLGYLAEGARTNLCLQSEVFDNASWTKTDVTVTANAIAAPDGNTTADLLTEGSAGTASVDQAITATANANYSVTRWVKRGNTDWYQLGVLNGINGARAWFNINTGVKGTAGAIGGGAGAVVSYSMQSFPNGWYRCQLVASCGAAVTAITFQSFNSSADFSTARASGATRYEWGAQFEDNVSFASSYIPTTTGAVARNADVLTYPSAGNALAATGSTYAELSTEWALLDASTFAGAVLYSSGIVGALSVSANSASTTIRTSDNVTSPIKSGLTDMSTGARKRASSYGGTGLSVTGDGAAPATGAFVGTMPLTGIYIGTNSTSTNQWFGTIRNVRIFSIQYPDNTLKVMTS